MNLSKITPIAAVLVLIVFVISGFQYNTLVSAEENAKTKWSDVEVQYQRRMDLIPNEVNVVKGASKYEMEALDKALRARNSWAEASRAGNIPGQIQAAQNLDKALPKFLMLSERYPQLAVTGMYKDLSIKLEGTENRIAVARRDYNQAVNIYNKKVRKFPTVLFAGAMGFSALPSFQAASGAEKAPEVSF